MRYIALLLLLACTPFPYQSNPAGLVTPAPASYFAKAESSTVSCSGLKPKPVHYYIVWAGTFQVDSNTEYLKAGHDYERDNILIAAPYIQDSMVVKHEILHHLIGGKHDHDNFLFSQCGL